VSADFNADLARLRTHRDRPDRHPDFDLGVVEVAARHGKTEGDIWDAIKPRHDCEVVSLSGVKPAAIRWLWPGRIPQGMYSLVAGQPGVGKSTIAFSIAAILSRGGIWPFTQDRAEIGDTIILTAEDDPAYTIVPRLLASEADLNRIRVIKSVARYDDDRVTDAPLLLSEDMHQLHGVLADYADTRLLIFDPLSAYLGVKDSHRDADVRQVLGPLTELAARHNVAVLGITHLSKNAAASAMSRFMGSMGIIAAARSAYLATRHEDELMFLPVKSNIAPDCGGLTYRIFGKEIGDGILTSAIEWTGQTDVEADEALAAQSAKHSAPKKHDAIVFLRNILKDGPVALEEIDAAAKQEGIAWATVRRAYDHLGIQSLRERKFQGRFLWHTPEQAAAMLTGEQDRK